MHREDPSMDMSKEACLRSVRPLVRYVDQEQAVIETHFAAGSPVEIAPMGRSQHKVEVMIEINGNDGFHDEGTIALELQDGHGAVRFDLVQPQRWWPAGMGKQQLYQLTISLIFRDEIIDSHETTLGLTSIRVPKAQTVPYDNEPVPLLVNGRECDIHSVVSIDASDEQKMLPAAGDSLLVVRGHYGPDVLYDAADRAGILLIQCVPIHPQGTPESEVQNHVDRLVRHPSLAGWCVGHLGQTAQSTAETIQTRDPTHGVFMNIPNVAAA